VRDARTGQGKDVDVQVVVGRLARAHGVRGLVRIDVRTDEPDRRFADGATFATERGPLTLLSTRWHGSALLARFDGVDDRAAADALRGVLLEVEIADDERPDDPDEYYDHQLVGLAVHDVRGDPRGVVSEVLHLPGQDLLAVVDPEEHERLVPFVRDLVTAVDLDRRVLVVDDPPGLLGDEPTADTDEGGLDAD
jgi:16S rRNA processing protein RimM